MAVSSLVIVDAQGADTYLNSADLAGGIDITYSLSNTGSWGSDVLVLIKDGSGNLLYWYTETSSSSAATIPAGALGTYQGTVQIQVFQGTGQTDGNNSGAYSGSFKTYPTSSQFTFHDSSLFGGNTAVTSSTTADASATRTVDTNAPTSLSGVTPDLEAASDTGVSNTDDKTTDTTPTLSVSLAGKTGLSAGDVIQIIDTSSGNAVVGTYTIVAGDLSGGAWNVGAKSITTSALSNGTHNLAVRLSDVAGNTGTAGSNLAVTIDSTAPTNIFQSSPQENVADAFNSAAYNLNTGSANWTTNWTENGDDNSATSTSGDFYVASDGGSNRLRITDQDSDTAEDYIQRTANLTGATKATLSFDYRRVSLETGDDVLVQVSSNGTTFTTVLTITGTANDANYLHASIDISAYISGTTVVRIVGTNAMAADDIVYIDNVDITYVAETAAGLPTQVADWQAGGNIVFNTANGNRISVSDNSASISVTLSVLSGTLTLGGTGGLTVSGNGTGTVTLSGSVANINAGLNGLTYHTTSGDIVSGDVNDTLTIVTSDGTSADTDTVQIDVICFYPGTLVRTPAGEAAVETLKRGDVVLTSDGRSMPVTWLGRQTVSTVFGDPLRVLPIRIKSGALGESLPARDLLVSPDHAILVDGALVQAGALVNGTSITREKGVPKTFTYYHVELDDHSLILAENVPAETFIDNVERLAFDNWAEHQALYPQGKAIAELPYPRAKSHRQVPVNIRVKLADRAQAIGAVEKTSSVA